MPSPLIRLVDGMQPVLAGMLGPGGGGVPVGVSGDERVHRRLLPGDSHPHTRKGYADTPAHPRR
eukprot:2386169-Pyramimonas_sp.AAC.1